MPNGVLHWLLAGRLKNGQLMTLQSSRGPRDQPEKHTAHAVPVACCGRLPVLSNQLQGTLTAKLPQQPSNHKQNNGSQSHHNLSASPLQSATAAIFAATTHSAGRRRAFKEQP